MLTIQISGQVFGHRTISELQDAGFRLQGVGGKTGALLKLVAISPFSFPQVVVGMLYKFLNCTSASYVQALASR